MMRNQLSSRGRVGVRLFWLLTLLYPRRFRRAYWGQLLEAYTAQRRESRYQGMFGRVRFGVEILIDTVRSALRRHVAVIGYGFPRGGFHLSPHGYAHRSRIENMTSSVIQDVRYALRGIARRPGFAALVVLVLAVGIGANVAMFSTMNQALIRPLPFPEPERLVLGRATFNGGINPFASAYDYFDYRDRNRVFEHLGAILFGPMDVTITGGDEPEQIAGTIVSWELFRTLGVPAQLGRHFSMDEGELEGPPVTVISHGYWQRSFGGSPDVVGRSITLNGAPLTIVGVMPASFEFLHDVDAWIPMRRDGPMANARRWHNWLLVGRLHPDVTLEQAQAEMDVISAQLASEYPETNRDKALLLTELHEAMAENYRTSLLLLMGAVGLVLLIACGNVGSLLLARGSVRRSELSIRAALGASGVRLMRQLLSESAVTAAAAGVLGTIIAVWLQKLILQFLPIDIPGMASQGISGSMLVFALALSVATGLLFGILPALRAAQTNVVEDIKSSTRTTDSGGSRVRSTLVVVQVAVSVILLIGSGLLIRSFANLRGVNPGFDSDNLLTAEIRLTRETFPERDQRIGFFSKLREDLEAVPGVTDVAVINQLPIRNPGNNIYVYAADKPPLDPNDRNVAFTRVVFPGYFDAMGIPLLQGRDVTRADEEGSALVLLINETMAETLFPGEDPIGRQVVVDQGEEVAYEVIGVVGDVRVSGPRNNPRLAMYGSYYQRQLFTMRVAIRTAIEPTGVARELRQIVWSQDRDIPIEELSTMTDLIARTVSRDRVLALSLTLFATVAMSLAAVGLYGVLAYYVSRRIREIGIRVALGAGGRDILGLVLRRGLGLVAVGIAVGLIGAFWVTRLIQQMLFTVEPTDPATFIAVSLFFALVALVACLIPAWKALRVDPLSALAVE